MQDAKNKLMMEAGRSRPDRIKWCSLILLLPLAFLILTGCTLKQTYRYSELQRGSFSQKLQPASIRNHDLSALLDEGYILLGVMEHNHNIMSCYSDNAACRYHDPDGFNLNVLTEKAADKGADIVTILEETPSLEPVSYSVCSSHTTTSYTDKEGNTRTLQVCTNYTSYSGYRETWDRVVLLWRHEPESVHSKQNQQAIIKLQDKLSTLYKTENPSVEGKNTLNDALEEGRQLQQEERSYAKLGNQLITADGINQDIKDSLKEYYRQQSEDALNTEALYKQLTDEAGDITSYLGKEDLYSFREGNLNALMLALSRERHGTVQLLLMENHDWSTAHEDDAGVEKYIVGFASIENTRSYFRQYSADIEKVERLVCGAVFGSRDDLDILLPFYDELGVDIRCQEYNYGLLLRALRNDNIAAATYIASQINDFDVILNDGKERSLMNYIIKYGGRRNFLSYLIEQRNLPVDWKNENGNNLISLTCLNGEADGVTYLLERGVSPNAKLKSGAYAAFFCLLRDDIAGLRAFIDAGLDESFLEALDYELLDIVMEYETSNFLKEYIEYRYSEADRCIFHPTQLDKIIDKKADDVLKIVGEFCFDDNPRYVELILTSLLEKEQHQHFKRIVNHGYQGLEYRPIVELAVRKGNKEFMTTMRKYQLNEMMSQAGN